MIDALMKLLIRTYKVMSAVLESYKLENKEGLKFDDDAGGDEGDESARVNFTTVSFSE